MRKRFEKSNLSKLSSYFHKWSRAWLILSILVVLVLFIIITLPIAQNASNGIVGLDTRHFYLPQEAFSVVSSYSEADRSTLIIFYLTADIVNPILYGLFLILLISWLFQMGFSPANFMQKLNLLPIGAVIFDLIENTGIIIMLSTYPKLFRGAAWLATTGTALKYFFLYSSFGLVFVGSIVAVVSRFKSTRR